MSVPTHNLYDFIHQVTEKKFNLLYFYPFGSKDISNLIMYQQHQKELDRIAKKDLIGCQIFKKSSTLFSRTFLINRYQPVLLCHDQEPLYFDLYQGKDLYRNLHKDTGVIDEVFKFDNFNLRWTIPLNDQKYWILLHSEKNSTELEKYENTNRFIGAYYWSHAFLSLDWFRFAEYDKSLASSHSRSDKQFLIYCRDNSGTRSYRKLFLEQLKSKDILQKCQIGSFNTKNTTSDFSAIYNAYDIKNTDFHVVLETVFDKRIHLTEKTCRALATGHPFFLAAGPGSLELLRSYGFKTFSPWIDESYDKETNSKIRMDKIIHSMEKYTQQSKNNRKKILQECLRVAQHNKTHFFSKQFKDICINELIHNVDQAYKKTCFDMFDVDRFFVNLAVRNQKLKTKDKIEQKKQFVTLDFFEHLKNGGTPEDYVPPDLD